MSTQVVVASPESGRRNAAFDRGYRVKIDGPRNASDDIV